MDLASLAGKLEAQGLPDDVSAMEDRLRGLDTHGVLWGRYREPLARALTLLERLEVPLDRVALIECGASQKGFRQDLSLYCGAISHFFALEGGKLPVEYTGYDPSVFPRNLSMFFDAEAKVDRKSWPYAGLDKERFLAAVARGAVNDYARVEEIVEVALREGKVPLILSNNVLTDLSEGGGQFWRLPGVHAHRTYFVEICDNTGTGYWEEYRTHVASLPEERRPRWNHCDGDGDEELLKSQVYHAQLKANPGKHHAKMRRRFSLHETTGITHLLCEERDIITYAWVNPAAKALE